jgi:hypothetical protein
VRRSNKEKLARIGLLALIALWSLPRVLSRPEGGLDPSHKLGIKMATLQGLQFGREIIFTYGPLGWLNPVYANHRLWLISVSYILLAHGLFFLSLALLLNRSRPEKLNYLVLLLLVPAVIFLERPYVLLLAATILIFLTAEKDGRNNYASLLGLSVCLAITSLIKFMAVPAAAGLLIAFFFISAGKKRVKEGAFAFLAYVAGFTSLWMLAGQKLTNLPAYFTTSYQLSSGYSDAMAIGDDAWQLVVGLSCIIFILALLIYASIKRHSSTANFIWLNVGTLFIAFKHGFVRNDCHAQIFFSVVGVILICLYFVQSKPGSLPVLKIGTIVFILIVAFSIQRLLVNLSTNVWEQNIFQKAPSYARATTLILHPSRGATIITDSKAAIRYVYRQDRALVEKVRGRTVDILPWDTAWIWANNLRWSPAPIFQSYSAYTQQLDNINAAHYSGGDAPQSIVYGLQAIDGRYPLFDEPAVFSTIMQNYSFEQKTKNFVLLAHQRQRKLGQKKTIAVQTVQVDRQIVVPKYRQGPLFAKIDFEYSKRGNLLKLVYKPMFTHIRFQFDDSSYSPYFRFVPSVAKDGILVSDYVENIDDLAKVFQGRHTRRITAIEILVHTYWQYQRQMKVTFFGMPFRDAQEPDGRQLAN